MKKRLPGILLGLVFLIGLGIFLYPNIADQWNRYHQSRAIASYTDAVENMTEEDFEAQWAAANDYNAAIIQNTFNGDAFSQEEKNMRGTDYWSVLNVGDDGIMGYISIPEINQRLPIYHGTSNSVLQIAAGHLSGTKLPIGGESTHSVIAAHRGLPSARLFTDVDQLVKGDKVYLHILDKVLAYQLDQILTMVDKDDTETLTKAMSVEEGQDYVTLFTCTPYGVNSHRFLLRGHRVEYHGEDDENADSNGSMVQNIKDYYMLYALLVTAAAILTAVIVKLLRKRSKGTAGKSKEGKE